MAVMFNQIVNLTPEGHDIMQCIVTVKCVCVCVRFFFARPLHPYLC